MWPTLFTGPMALENGASQAILYLKIIIPQELPPSQELFPLLTTAEMANIYELSSGRQCTKHFIGNFI